MRIIMRRTTDNEKYLRDFVLHLVGKSKKPIEFYPPDYQQIAFLIDKEIPKKENVYIPFNQPCIWGPKSKELEETIEELSIMGCYSPIAMDRTNDKLGIKRVIYAREEHYRIMPVGPSIPVIDLFYIPANALWQTRKFLSNKINGRKNLPEEYARAEKELKEKYLGKIGLEEMDLLIEEYTNFPIKDIYKFAQETHLEENPSIQPVWVPIP
ncbi:MAG: hypothetical protein KKB09_03530 [Nanoarchaeota archaeon]|nr:hypothetical protein [Nanoarchaeota archaeon]